MVAGYRPPNMFDNKKQVQTKQIAEVEADDFKPHPGMPRTQS